MKRTSIQHEFVEFIPTTLVQGTLYISMEYATAAHQCLCGCGQRVVTPISPSDWKMSFDGVSVSLHPSVGNWSFPCQSHYWIRDNEVLWDKRMSPDQIGRVRAHDQRVKSRVLDGSGVRPPDVERGRETLGQKLKRLLLGESK